MSAYLVGPGISYNDEHVYHLHQRLSQKSTQKIYASLVPEKMRVYADFANALEWARRNETSTWHETKPAYRSPGPGFPVHTFYHPAEGYTTYQHRPIFQVQITDDKISRVERVWLSCSEESLAVLPGDFPVYEGPKRIAGSEAITYCGCLPSSRRRQVSREIRASGVIGAPVNPSLDFRMG